MNSHYEKLKEVFYKKIRIIILFSFLCACALVAEKYYTSDFMVQSGGFCITAIANINDPERMQNPYIELEYGKLIRTNSNFADFLSTTEKTNKYDFNKVYGNWKNLQGEKKYEWMRKHINVYNAHNGVVEFSIEIKENEPKDITYLKENADEIMDDFVKQSEQTINAVRPGTKIEIKRKTMTIPENIYLSKKSIMIKYGIIGFILGGCLATLVIFIKTLGIER